MEISSSKLTNFLSTNTYNVKTETSEVEIAKEHKNVENVVESINQFLRPLNTSVQFSFHEELNEYYVSIVDLETKEIVKEIPPKKLLDMYAEMAKFMGLFIDQKI
ncbi:flagellar protein FlaG [Sutcliffiella cohnii]|uniref:flagellar protein FlaG n=1 Tax=Sutcliffiella cohnii TaxID=33932 RepID=UPI002E201B82|nr:flagellar protein FlaG [Sutcliffiella cohnii]